MSNRARSNKGSNADGGDKGAFGGVPMMVTDKTIEPEVSFPGQSCRVCRAKDTEEMVRCDKCLKWFHFACVGVTQAIESEPWSCTNCASAIQDSVNPANDPSFHHGGVKKKQNIAEDAVKFILSTHHQPSNLPTLKVTKSVATETFPEHKRTEKKMRKERLEQEECKRPSTSDNKTSKPVASHASSHGSSSSSLALAKLKLQRLEEERTLNEKKLEQDRAYLDEKYKLLEEIASEGGSDLHSVSDVVGRWLPPAQSSHYSHPEDQQSVSVSHESLHLSRGCPNNYVGTHRTGPFAEEQRSVHRLTQRDTLQFEGRCPLSNKQLAARQAVSKDLPQFSGNPGDWPLFIATFNNTTAMCGYTNDENIFRLQKCLSGRALEAVKSRLVHPANDPGVLKTLRMMFGQPEAIIHTLIERIHSLPAVREDKLETLVDFAVSVENFCATVDACGLDEYLYNITLLHQLVSKLPSTIKLNWAQYRISLPAANLAAFSTWIYSLAEAASAISIPSITRYKPARGERSGVNMENAYVNAHSKNTSLETSPSSYSSWKKSYTSGECRVCNADCKTVEKCKRFLELSHDSRWAIVREFTLCRRCLSRHEGVCQAKPCGKNGCHFKHHALLHNDHWQQSTSNPTTTPTTTVPSNSGGTEAVTTEASSVVHGCHTHHAKSSNILLRYLPVVLHSKHRSIRTHAFLDDGSDLTLLDEELADALKLDGNVRSLRLNWTGGAQRQEVNSRIVQLDIAGVHREAKSFTISDVRTVNELSLPYQTMNVGELSSSYPHLHGLSIDSYHNVRPRILIGLRNQHLSLALEYRVGKLNDPVAVKTRLGWTVCGGRTAEVSTDSLHSLYHISSCENNNIADDGEIGMHGPISAYSQATEDTNNPIILPPDHQNTKLIIAHRRNKNHRQDLPIVINKHRQKYHIPRLQATYAKVHCKTNVFKVNSMRVFGGTETTWKVNPPSSRHTGDNLERLIGIMKWNLIAIRPQHEPTNEVLQNLFEPVHTVNYRPLTHVPVDNESSSALTPNHAGTVLRRTGRMLQQLANQLWKRWLTKYLSEITCRTKWHANTESIAIAYPKLLQGCWSKSKFIGLIVN